MTKTQNTKQYELEDRTIAFAKNFRVHIEKLRKSIADAEDSKQLIRA